MASTGRQLRILVTLGSPSMLRIYDATLRALADRGHRVTLAVNAFKPSVDVVDINDERIRFAGVVPKRRDVWAAFLRSLRTRMDFVHYLDGRFADTPLLQTRMYRQAVPGPLRRVWKLRSISTLRVVRLLRVLKAIESAVPLNGRVARFLAKQRPDVVFVSPLIHGIADQDDLVRAARSTGVPVVAGIAGWDNLTSKGRLRAKTDAIVVWNDQLQREAIEFHGVEPERVVVTGAQVYDYLFERHPRATRDEFCRMLRLPADRVLILFAGSSRVVGQSKRSKAEIPFVRDWLAALRASGDPRLRDAAVLIRPHPLMIDRWKDADFSDLGPVAVWPSTSVAGTDEHRTTLFDSLFHCDAVVGLNTSVMIEASILRKPVLSIVLPDFADVQDGTRCFRYLRPEHGGFLQLASSFEQHLEQLSAALHAPELVAAEAERFVASFVRPHGAGTACAPLLADAIEQVGWMGIAPSRQEPRGSRTVRALLWPVAVGMGWWETRDSRSSG